MFIAYERSIQLIHSLRDLLPIIKKQDRDLADQLHRAATSVWLDLSEGSRMLDGNGSRHFMLAQGSAKEVKAGLEVAVAWGWITEASGPHAILDEVLTILWRLTRGPRRT